MDVSETGSFLPALLAAEGRRQETGETFLVIAAAILVVCALVTWRALHPPRRNHPLPKPHTPRRESRAERAERRRKELEGERRTEQEFEEAARAQRERERERREQQALEDSEKDRTLLVYYKVLGLKPKKVTRAAIEEAYRKAALRNHPDKSPDDPFAAERFRAIQEAYEVLLREVSR